MRAPVVLVLCLHPACAPLWKLVSICECDSCLFMVVVVKCVCVCVFLMEGVEEEEEGGVCWKSRGLPADRRGACCFLLGMLL